MQKCFKNLLKIFSFDFSYFENRDPAKKKNRLIISGSIGNKYLEQIYFY